MGVPHPRIYLAAMGPTLLTLAVTAVESGATSRGHVPQTQAVLRGSWPLPPQRAEQAPSGPLRLLGRASLPGCRHCGGERVQRWGRAKGRQRYRCVACGRTYSEFTGTALHGLQRPDLWPAFCRCILQGRTVRATAAEIGVHRDTAFRWRHRFLREVRDGELYRIGPRVRIGEGKVYDRLWVLLGLDERGRAAAIPVGLLRPRAGDVRRLLWGRLEPRACLFSSAGRFGSAGTFTQQAEIGWSRSSLAPSGTDEFSERPELCLLRFRRWLKKFRGVAAHYLDNYLAWFRTLDRQLWAGLAYPPTSMRS